jgi:hypothetical protein
MDLLQRKPVLRDMVTGAKAAGVARIAQKAAAVAVKLRSVPPHNGRGCHQHGSYYSDY